MSSAKACHLLDRINQLQLDTDVPFESYVKQPEYQLDCRTTPSGTHYHFIPAKGSRLPIW